MHTHPLFRLSLVVALALLLAAPALAQNAPPLVIAPEEPITEPLLPAQQFRLLVSAGDANLPVEDLFGVSFRLTYDPELFELLEVEEINTQSQGGFADCDNDETPDIVTFSNTETPGVLVYSISRRGDRCEIGVNLVQLLLPALFTVRADATGGEGTFAFTNVTAIDSNGDPVQLDPQSLTLEVFGGLLVWPGDTNDDNEDVSTVDIIPVAAFFDVTGPARAEAEQGIQFEAKRATAWPVPNENPPPYNLAHADADGNGAINEADVLAVGLNYGQAPGTPFAPDPTSARGTSLASLTIPPHPVDDVIEVALGLEVLPDDDALGVSSLWEVPEPLAIEAVEAGEWLDDGNLLTLDTFADATRTLDAAALRVNGADILDGTGDALVLRLRVTAEMPASVDLVLDRLHFGTTNGTASDVPADRVTLTLVTTTDAEEEGTPVAFALHANYPNPFAARTTIRYELAEPRAVRLEVYDLLGRRVATLVDEEQAAGRYDAVFERAGLANGTYVLRLRAGSFMAAERMSIVR